MILVLFGNVKVTLILKNSCVVLMCRITHFMSLHSVETTSPKMSVIQRYYWTTRLTLTEYEVIIFAHRVKVRETIVKRL